MIQMLRFYSLTVVAYREFIKMAAFVFHFATGNLQTCCSCGVGNSIINEIAEDAVDQTCVALHFYMLWHVERWRNAFFLKLQSSIIERILHNLQNINMTVFIVGFGYIVIHLIKFGESTHVE